MPLSKVGLQGRLEHGLDQPEVIIVIYYINQIDHSNGYGTPAIKFPLSEIRGYELLYVLVFGNARAHD